MVDTTPAESGPDIFRIVALPLSAMNSASLGFDDQPLGPH